ncbi:MAG: hypothetical protein OEW98_08685, partial [Betaproteobacteria bacterium]|nr:hypothetical protein [Betaproteobacteria bacterium]
LAPNATVSLPGAVRVVYVREGELRIQAGARTKDFAANSAWHGRESVAITAGQTGAAVLRWELLAATNAAGEDGTGSESAGTLAREISLDEQGSYLVRCDRVDFPPGGIAYTHVHRGPGIRCLLKGAIRVEVNGKKHDIAPGGAWFEAGPDPVLALASETEPTAFVRVMILPAELKGKSSIRYVKPEDADKPKRQTYRVFVDELIELP